MLCYTFLEESDMNDQQKTPYSWCDPRTDALFTAILALRDRDETCRFFRDLLTEQEIKEFARRWQAACLLAQGKKYTDIESQTQMSSKTIARIQRFLNGELGGYRLALARSGS